MATASQKMMLQGQKPSNSKVFMTDSLRHSYIKQAVWVRDVIRNCSSCICWTREWSCTWPNSWFWFVGPSHHHQWCLSQWCRSPWGEKDTMDSNANLLHQTHTRVPVSQFLIYTIGFPEALRMRNLFQPPVIYSLITCGFIGGSTHQAAPTTDREMARPMPRPAHMKGDVSVRNLPAKTETKHSTISLRSTKTPWSRSFVCLSRLDFISFVANCDIMQLRKIPQVCKARHSSIFVKKNQNAKNIQNEMWLKFYLCVRIL